MTDPITSHHNPKLKQLRKLAERKQRDGSGLFAAEGEDLLAEALRSKRQPQSVFYDVQAQAKLRPLLERLGPETEQQPVDARALAAVSSLGSGSRVIGVWHQRWIAADAGELSTELPLLYLHGASDPGNVGSIVRSAHALGVAGVALGPGSADPHGPKAVRASMGAVFSVPLLRTEFGALLAAQSQRRAIAMAVGQGRSLHEVAGPPAPLFVLGAEREGLPDRIASACAEIAHIPLDPGGAESLNVAMAATLCLYENALHRLGATAKEPSS